ncbi:MAG: reverse transcriptase domain-containing protein [Planctomycetota bacterium]
METGLPAGFKKATFADLYSEVELHKAALKVFTRPLFAWRKALVRSYDGLTLYDFARHAHTNLDIIHRRLKGRRFEFREGLELVYNLNGRVRTFCIFPWEERIVDTLLYRMLSRYFHVVFSPNCYAYRCRGYGVDPCQHRLIDYIHGHDLPLYAVKRDIQNYFPSIPHDRLLAMLAEWVDPNDHLFELLATRVRYRVREDDGGVRTAERGIPFGAAISCFFANLYLTPVDRAMEQVADTAYFRYADDMLAVTPDRDRAIQAAACLDGGFAELGLAGNPRHHAAFRLDEAAAVDADPVFTSVTRFRHLGLEFRADGSVGLGRDKARKIRNLFRFAFRRARRRLGPSKTVEERARLACTIAADVVGKALRGVAVIDYYLKHIDDEHQLMMIDRWLAEEVLAIAFRNGHKKGNFRRMPFAKLREFGLPSLRHRHRLIRHGHLPGSFFQLRTETIIAREQERLSFRPKVEFSPRLEAAAGVDPREKGVSPVDGCH